MAELVDAPDSKSGSGNRVRVRFSLPAPLKVYLTIMNYCADCGSKTLIKIPKGDNRERIICSECKIIHYQNPKIVVGCIPEVEGKILLCKRAIEPRYGYWTIPAGFLELEETMQEGAIRETKEEACADVKIGHLFASVDVVRVGQVHIFFTASLVSSFAAGEESLGVKLFNKDEIPWDELAFESGIFALKKYYEDQGINNGVHSLKIDRKRPKSD